MSAIGIGGRRYAAGLYWLGRGSAGATARTARRLGRPWCVHRGDRTGFAGEDLHASPEGLPALAPALLDLIRGEFWMALVEGDAETGDPGTGDTAADGTGHYALVKARGGTVLADGDEVFETRAAALAAFERARALGWALHATPGLVAGLPGSGIAALDIAALEEAASRAGAAIRLQAAAQARPRGGWALLSALGLAVLAGIAGAWFERDALLAWLAGAAPVEAPAFHPEPIFSATVDGAALIAACRRALIENPPFLPAWRIERIACAARFADPELTALSPELAGRPVLLVRWQLVSGHAEALQRRLSEAHLSGWHAATVADGRAWAVAPLAPVLRVGEIAVPRFLDLRRAVDRALGAGGARIGYGRGAEGAWTIRIDDPGPLSRLAPLIGGIAGLEITSLTRGTGGGWHLDGRPAAPERLTGARLRELGVDPGVIPGSAAGAQEPVMGPQSNEQTEASSWNVIAGRTATERSAARTGCGLGCWPAPARPRCWRLDRRLDRSRPTSVFTAARRWRTHTRSKPRGATWRPTSWTSPRERRGWTGAVPPAAVGWQAGWTVRGLEARYCGDTLLVYLAPEQLKGVGRDHRAVHVAPHAYAGSGETPVLHWLENGVAQGGVGRASVALPACLSEAAAGGPLPTGRAALAGTVRDPYRHTTERVARERKEEDCGAGEHGEGRTLIREATQDFNGRGEAVGDPAHGPWRVSIDLCRADYSQWEHYTLACHWEAGPPHNRRMDGREVWRRLENGDVRRREPGRARIRLDELLDGRGAAPGAGAGGERDRVGGDQERGLSGRLHRESRLPAHGDVALHTLPLGPGAGDADDYRRVDPRQRRLRSRGRAGLGRPGSSRPGRSRGRSRRGIGNSRRRQLRPFAQRHTGAAARTHAASTAAVSAT